jgi:hypothetical protein
LRIGAQELEKLRQRSGKIYLGFERLHLGPDAGDFVEADLVDLLGRQVCGGVLARVERVRLRSIGHLPDADAVVAGGQILLFEEVLELPVGGHQKLLDRDDGVIGQRFLLFGGKRGGIRFEWPVKGTVLRFIDDLLGDLRGDPAHDDLRQQDFLLHALAHQGGGLRDEIRQLVQPLEPILVILDRVKGQGGNHVVGGLHPALLAERAEKEAEAEPLDVHREIALVKIVVELIRRRQRRPVDRAQSFEGFLRVNMPRLDRGERLVLPTVIEPVIAEAGGPGGIFLHCIIPLGGQEVSEHLIGGGSGGVAGRSAHTKQNAEGGDPGPVANAAVKRRAGQIHGWMLRQNY